MGGINVSCHMCLFSVEVTCRGPAPAGSRGYPWDERRWREKEREKTRETSLDRAKSATERERERERPDGVCSRVWQGLGNAFFFTVAFIA